MAGCVAVCAVVAATLGGCMTEPGSSGGGGTAWAAEAPSDDGPPVASTSTGPVGIDEYLRRIEAFGFSGVALVGRGDQVVHASGHGMADREAARPFTTGTVVGLGSITKVYTAAAILGLVGRDVLSLDDTLGAFVEDLPGDRSGITLAQLLTHSSGLGEIPHPDEEEVSRSLMLEETRELPLLDTPGGSVSYSNLGYSLLAVVLEEATGLPYEEALRREVLDPIRAWETGYALAGWGPERVAAGYRQGERWGTIIEKFPDPSGPSWTLVGNGGLHTTVFDAFRFVRAFMGGEIVPPELVATSMEPYRGRFQARGLGWQLFTAPDGSRMVGHDGSNNFLTASVRYLPEQDMTVMLAANQSGFTAVDAMPAFLRLATGMSAPLPPEITPQPLADSERRALEGEWAVGDGRLEVVDGGDHLQLRVMGQPLLDRVLAITPEVRARLGEDTERARGLVEAGLEGDFSNSRTLERVWDFYEDRFGPVEGVEVLGSAPVWYFSPRASWLRFHVAGSDRSPIRRLHWTEDGELAGIGGSVYPAPLTLRCVGTGPRTCTAMHLNLDIEPVRLTLLEEGLARLEVGDLSLDARLTGAGPGMGSGMLR